MIVLNIEILPIDWNEGNGKLDSPSQYSLFKIDSSVTGYSMGMSECGCYSIIVNPYSDDFKERLFDFIEYENNYERCVLIYSAKFNVNTILSEHKAHNKGIRKSDSKYAVHSTLLSSYEKIIESGCLKSTSRLNKEGVQQKAIGFMPLGEPKDYLDYIMFGSMDNQNIGSEIVVNSHFLGKVCFDSNAPYTPQVRMYFDAHKIINDGLVIRDGVHHLKVFDTLPLEEYLLLSVFEKDVALPSGEEYWTPASFTKAANNFFLKFMGENKTWE